MIRRRQYVEIWIVIIVFLINGRVLAQPNCKIEPDVAVNIQNFHVLRPIPQAQLDAVTNRGDFVQNPGYQ